MDDVMIMGHYGLPKSHSVIPEVITMETQTIVTPETKSEMVLQPGIIYTVPADVLVMEVATMQLIQQTEISTDLATQVILIPAVAGG